MTAPHSGKPTLPPAAESEILERLYSNMQISADEVAAILKKHNVSGDVDILQDRYRKQLGQRLIAGIRDDEGKREVLPTETVGMWCWNAVVMNSSSKASAAGFRAR